MEKIKIWFLANKKMALIGAGVAAAIAVFFFLKKKKRKF
jgi:LPXTG-motif cell wall-anchored protein